MNALIILGYIAVPMVIIGEAWRVIMIRKEIRKLSQNLEASIEKFDVKHTVRYNDLYSRIKKLEGFKLKSDNIWISDNNNPNFPNTER